MHIAEMDYSKTQNIEKSIYLRIFSQQRNDITSLSVKKEKEKKKKKRNISIVLFEIHVVNG